MSFAFPGFRAWRLDFSVGQSPDVRGRSRVSIEASRKTETRQRQIAQLFSAGYPAPFAIGCGLGILRLKGGPRGGGTAAL